MPPYKSRSALRQGLLLPLAVTLSNIPHEMVKTHPSVDFWTAAGYMNAEKSLENPRRLAWLSLPEANCRMRNSKS